MKSLNSKVTDSFLLHHIEVEVLVDYILQLLQVLFLSMLQFSHLLTQKNNTDYQIPIQFGYNGL